MSGRLRQGEVYSWAEFCHYVWGWGAFDAHQALYGGRGARGEHLFTVCRGVLGSGGGLVVWVGGNGDVRVLNSRGLRNWAAELRRRFVAGTL